MGRRGPRLRPRARYQLVLAYQRAGDAAKCQEHQEIYNRLTQEQKAETIGVRGNENPTPFVWTKKPADVICRAPRHAR